MQLAVGRWRRWQRSAYLCPSALRDWFSLASQRELHREAHRRCALLPSCTPLLRCSVLTRVLRNIRFPATTTAARNIERRHSLRHIAERQGRPRRRSYARGWAWNCCSTGSGRRDCLCHRPHDALLIVRDESPGNDRGHRRAGRSGRRPWYRCPSRSSGARQVRALVARIEREQGALHILVTTSSA